MLVPPGHWHLCPQHWFSLSDAGWHLESSPQHDWEDKCPSLPKRITSAQPASLFLPGTSSIPASLPSSLRCLPSLFPTLLLRGTEMWLLPHWFHSFYHFFLFLKTDPLQGWQSSCPSHCTPCFAVYPPDPWPFSPSASLPTAAGTWLLASHPSTPGKLSHHLWAQFLHRQKTNASSGQMRNIMSLASILA